MAPVTLDEAVAQVQARTGGRVLSAETLDEEGQRVHRIRVLLQDQRVRDIRVDAATGQWQ
ncbi:PepSY domain-containing protein [Ectothiorhodospira mobilis]|uniref:PepSY domain-containing protein n=1 Tax=Ectothiorhodospira mobilis TaxID=195064 RepID=UPI001EE7EA79|nr:PepSY domain-containing protein [Ectothiorhodospira mobilis]MCG5535939.1 PepSY domain-containing protein [Ectothiorhodospira mobilis]